MNDTGKLIKNTTIYAIGDVIPKVFGFITFPILTKSIAPDEYGILAYINSIDVFIVMAGLLCLNTYYLVYYYKVGGEAEKRNLLGNLSLFIIANYLIIAALLFVFGPRFFQLIGSGVDFYPYIAIGIATAFFTIITILPSALYRVRETPAPLTILNVIRGFAIMAFTILSVYVFKPCAVNVLWARFAATAVFGLVFLYITFRNATFKLNIPQLKHALAFSIPLVPATLASSLFTVFDKILIDKYVSLTELGLYSTAATLAQLLNIVSVGAYKAFEPHFFKTYGTQGFNSSFAKVRDLLLFVVLFFALCISGFSQEFLYFFSDKQYETSRYYIPVLTIGFVFSAMSLMYGTIVTAREKTKISAAITISGVLLSIIFDIVFLRYWGIWAAVFNILFSFVFLCYGNMIFAKVKVGHIMPFITICIAAIVMELMTYCFNNDNVIINIFAKSIVIALTTLLFMRLLKIDFKAIIKSFR